MFALRRRENLMNERSAAAEKCGQGNAIQLDVLERQINHPFRASVGTNFSGRIHENLLPRTIKRREKEDCANCEFHSPAFFFVFALQAEQCDSHS